MICIFLHSGANLTADFCLNLVLIHCSGKLTNQETLLSHDMYLEYFTSNFGFLVILMFLPAVVMDWIFCS